MKDSEPIGLFDLDGSLADYEGALRLELQALFDNVPDNLWDAESQPHFERAIDLIRSQPGWWARLPSLNDGLVVFSLAKKIGFDCQILTKGPRRFPLAWKEKVEWSQRHFGDDIDIHIVSDKKLVYGRFLYDDYPDYMERWLKHRPRGLGIMPDTPYNSDFQHERVVKFNFWNIDEVQAAMQAAFDRADGEPLLLTTTT